MNNHTSLYCFVLVATLFLVAENTHAQSINDEFKQKLKQSLKSNDPHLKPELKHQPFQVQQDQKDVLKVSPTTKLPSQFDKIELLEPLVPEQRIHINLNVTNIDTESQLARSSIDYSTGKVHEIPDSRSKLQWMQYTRNDYGLGIYADEDSPEWLRIIRNKTTPRYRNIDLDPIRYFQRRKARKHKEQVDKIKKVYEQE